LSKLARPILCSYWIADFNGVASRAFENWQGEISAVLNSGKKVSDEQFSFEKRAAQRPPLLKGNDSEQ
jgi:hypothetical protein